MRDKWISGRISFLSPPQAIFFLFSRYPIKFCIVFQVILVNISSWTPEISQLYAGQIYAGQALNGAIYAGRPTNPAYNMRDKETMIIPAPETIY